jgi:Protein of unknown function (DUF1778)
MKMGFSAPLQPVQLAEHRRVVVTIDDDGPAAESVDQVALTLPPERWQAFCDALDAPPKDIPALRRLLTEASIFDDHGKPAH